MIQFGPMSITLLIGAMYGVLFAALLWWTAQNRSANRFLAALLIVIAMRLFPYIIGYAGYYDAYPWLSFAPYNASLAFGPLLYFYVYCLSSPDSRASRGWPWHFLPVVIQLIYYCVIFSFPLAAKNDWDGRVQVPWVNPIEQIATFFSIAVYWALSYKHYFAYQQWLVQNVSDREDHHVEWVRNFLIALAITLVLWAGLAAFERWVSALNYFQRYPLYLWLTVLTYYLGTEGYRHARHRYPAWLSAAAQAPVTGVQVLEPSAPAAAETSPRDWRAIGETWKQRIESERWWQDPALNLAGLARKLGTNTSDLSRAINDGLALNFNELINRMRVDAVRASLANANDNRSLLDIAFDAGFSSKASFNRSFKLLAGETPSQFRRRVALRCSHAEGLAD
jgi:AraC-like DNA-binding protein